MRKPIYVVFAILLLGVVACREEADQTAVVADIARMYYGCLLDGKYEEFVACMDMSEKVPADYRSQLADNAKMFMAQMREEHKGIDSVLVCRASLDSTACSASVFLMLHYGDSTVEQVVVPMVKRGEVWYMR